MKINFKILYSWYIVIVALMLFSTCVKISDVAAGFVEGYDLAYKKLSENMEKEDALPMIWAGSNIRIDADSLQNMPLPIKLKSGDNGACVELFPVAYTVVASGNIGEKEKMSTLSAIQSVVAFSVLIISIAVLFIIVRLFIRMNFALKKREIFDMRVIRTMQTLGWLLLAQAAVNAVFLYIQTLLGGCVLSGYDMDVAFFEGIDYTRFILAFVTIMISEIFKIGHDIREEQNLTI